MELIPVNEVDDSLIWGEAKSLSRQSDMKFKLGAVIVKRGKIIGFGYNQRKTHRRFGSKKEFMTLHSEGSAIWSSEKLGHDTNGATMYIYRKNCRNSKPCESCQRLIEKAGIKRVIYTNG